MNKGLYVVGRNQQMGLGTMTEEFCLAMQPEKVILIDCQDGRINKDVEIENSVTFTRHEWMSKDGLVAQELAGAEVVVGFELWYNDRLPAIAKPAKTVLFPMWEWSHPNAEKDNDLLIALSHTDAEKYPSAVRYDWPASPLVHDPNRKINWPPRRFVHFAGNAYHNRDGTREVLASAERIGPEAELIVYSNFEIPWQVPPNITVRKSLPDRRALLDGVDCAIFPRGLGGHSLPINEVTGEGIPCIVLDLPDWERWPYKMTAYPSATRLRGYGKPYVLQQADGAQLGKFIRQMTEGRTPLQPCPKLPSWDDFKQAWNTWNLTKV